jgi:hypothetical protein
MVMEDGGGLWERRGAWRDERRAYIYVCDALALVETNNKAVCFVSVWSYHLIVLIYQSYSYDRILRKCRMDAIL